MDSSMSEKLFTAVGALKFMIFELMRFSVILRRVIPLFKCPFYFLRLANIS